MNTYISGSLVRSVAAFANSSGVLTNPSSISLKYRAGTGAVTTISGPINDAAGAYHWDIDTSGWTGPGNLLYTCQWTGTGAIQAIGDDHFEVEPAAL
jgi:hypothetical protein